MIQGNDHIPAHHKERRRFYRVVDIVNFHYIQSYDDITQMNRSLTDFFTDDIGYINFKFENYVKQKKLTYVQDIKSILNDKSGHDEVEKALITLSKKVVLLEKALLKISNGVSPIKDRVFYTQYKKLIKPIATHMISGNERTRSLIDKFDEKILYFLGVVDRVANNSSFDEIYSEDFVKGFSIEEDITLLRRVNKLKKSSLAKVFIYLYDHLDEIVRVFNDVVNGRAYAERPDLWQSRKIKISAGGLGFSTTYKLNPGMILDTFLTLKGITNRDGKPFHLRQSVKVIRVEDQGDTYYVGTQFLGLKTEYIDLINSFVFKHEVDESLVFLRNTPEADMFLEFDL